VARDVSLMLQLKYHAKGGDSGENAEPEDNGHRVLVANAGASWNFSKAAQLYAFVQFPLYQYVNRVQLTAKVAYAAGVSWRF